MDTKAMEAATKALMAEYLQAQEEQKRALAAAKEASASLERAQVEYAEARAAEAAGESEMARAGELLAAGLRELSVDEVQVSVASPSLPRIADSLVEYHANIGCYQCYLFPADAGKPSGSGSLLDASTLSLHVDFPRVELMYTTKSAPTASLDKDTEKPTAIWSTKIERNVEAAQCTVELKPDHVYLRLPIRASDKQPLGGFSSFTQVSAAELRTESYASVCCRMCESELLAAPASDDGSTPMEKVLPLPSANWMDMFDFWGAGIGAFEHIPRDDISAQRRRVLVGESYVLMHGDDLEAHATTEGKEEEAAVALGDSPKEEREWIPLSCTACSERIGLRSVEQKHTVRLHKHLISARSSQKTGDLEGNVFDKYTVDSIVSAKLLELADSDGIFRYILAPTDKEQESGAHSKLATELQVQLLSWETMLQRHGRADFRRVLKVLYKPWTASQPVVPAIPPSHKVALPPAMCVSIAQRLQNSSTMLPPSLREFNRMQVGYLFA